MKKNLITALKKLLTAFGGDAEQTKNNAVEIVDKIADSVEQGGGGSGGGVLICTDTNGTLDKTFGEIQTAYNSGKQIHVSGALVVYVSPIGYSSREQKYFANISVGEIYTPELGVFDFKSYGVTAATEAEILAAYPTL